MSGADVGTARSSGATLVSGRYRLVALIASGGMGRVWRAHDEALDRPVAVKELFAPAGVAAGDRRTQDLGSMAEARAAARIEHPGVVRVYDVLRSTGRSWIVMEFVRSRSLQERLDREGPMPHAEAARVGLAVLRALRAAHAAGVLHLDVKPHNILLALDGRIMLTDFGLATFAGRRPDAGGPLVGSPQYVAPERLHDQSSGAGTDLWSLGATLYTAVEGRSPFKRPTVPQTLSAVRDDDPDPVRHDGPVHEVIAGLLVKDPEHRLGAADTEAALARIAGAPAPETPAPEVPAAEATQVLPPTPVIPAQRRPAGDTFRRGSAPVTPAAGPPAPPPGRRKPIVWAGAVAAGVAAVVAAAVLVPRAESRDEAPPAPAAATTAAASVLPTACDAASGAATALDPTGFRVTLPAGWIRSTGPGVVCLSDPGRTRSLEVRRDPAVDTEPLTHWQDAERAAIDRGQLPGYRKISMGVLLVTSGGADWEYTWQPAEGPRLHQHRYLLWAGDDPSYELTWTTRDDDREAAGPVERAIVATFVDPSRSASPWAVPSPVRTASD